MCSRVSLRVATKYYFSGKKIRKISISDAKILKLKQRTGTKVIDVSHIVLRYSYLAKLSISQKGVHSFH